MPRVGSDPRDRRRARTRAVDLDEVVDSREVPGLGQAGDQEVSRSWRDHVEFTYEGDRVFILDPQSEPPRYMHIGNVWKSYGQSRRRRDRGAVVMKGWAADTVDGKYLGVFHSRDAAANALEDERQGVRRR